MSEECEREFNELTGSGPRIVNTNSRSKMYTFWPLTGTRRT